MEDVLAVYARPYTPDYPVVCMDEKPFQLLDERYQPIPMSEKNHTAKVDHEYEKKGTSSIFVFTEPLGCWRDATAFPTRKREDWAHRVKWLIDEQYPDAKKIVLTMDNLNTHGIESLYKTFPPAEAFRLSQRLEIHYTPKHGSWLNIAEIELSALSNQCLANRRIPSITALNEELAAWHQTRNASQKGVEWHFTTDDARVKLAHLYPIIIM